MRLVLFSLACGAGLLFLLYHAVNYTNGILSF